MEHMNDVRELTAAELNEVSGGVSFSVVAVEANVGIGQVNQQSAAFLNANVGIGQQNNPPPA